MDGDPPKGLAPVHGFIHILGIHLNVLSPVPIQGDEEMTET